MPLRLAFCSALLVVARASSEDSCSLLQQPPGHVGMLESVQAGEKEIHITIDIQTRLDATKNFRTVLELKKKEKARQHGITPDMLYDSGQVTYTDVDGHTTPVMGPDDIDKFPGKLTFAFEIASKDDMYIMNSYEKVFPSGNRNNGGFAWSSWLLSQSEKFSPELFQKHFASFCGVSGSPLARQESNASYSRWRLQLKDVGGKVSRHGFMHYCTGCRGWPCLCDARDFLRLDTKTVVLKGGIKKQYRFVVVGDPCSNEALLHTPYFEPDQKAEFQIKDVSPAVACENGRLKKAMLSDNGHVILAMFHDDDAALASEAFQEEDYDSQCKDRAANGFMGGMGMIFRKFAGVTPLDSEAEAQAKLAPTKSASGVKTSSSFAESNAKSMQAMSMGSQLRWRPQAYGHSH